MAPSAISPNEGHSGVESPLKPVCQIVTPVGMLGYGFEEEWTEIALARCAHVAPTALILDSGSTDSGPSKLALGTTTCPREAYERDLRKLIRLSIKYHVPVITSSAGGDGSNDHVDLFIKILREICDEESNKSWKLKAVAIYSEIDKSLVHSRLQKGLIVGCGPTVPALTPAIIDQTPRIVAQMGPEPFLDAMIHNPDFHVLVGGRAYDPAPYVAFAAYHLLEPKYRDISHLSNDALGAINHMGKILECGGICATPKGLGAMGVVNSDLSIDIRPLDPNARCVPLGVAAHTLYEKTRPDLLAGPGGVLDLTTSQYTQLDDGITTRLSGSKFYLAQRQNKPYTVKLEGARVVGFRTVAMGSFSDPILISQIHPFLESAKQYARRQNDTDQKNIDIGFHIYGLDETKPEISPAQIFVVAETIAPSQRLATSLASALRVYFSHGPYAGQKATSGNFGMGIGGRFELEVAECAEFCIYHLMTLAKGEETASSINNGQVDGLFHWAVSIVGKGDLPDYLSSAHYGSLAVPRSTASKPKSVVSSVAPAQGPSSTGQLGSAKTLFDLAKVVRSKNAGPFEVTLDVMFDDPKIYNAVKSSGILTEQVIANLYNIPVTDIIWAGFFDVAMAFKATMPRRRSGKPSCSGGFMEDDVHGSQQYAPLRNIALPKDFLKAMASC